MQKQTDIRQVFCSSTRHAKEMLTRRELQPDCATSYILTPYTIIVIIYIRSITRKNIKKYKSNVLLDKFLFYLKGVIKFIP